ncbi:hypothetical protein [Microbacterium sp. 10M-3C3]|jgi:hypothetical protein|uniref:hypothetical protein n=1 Tax=Microbacterium sp. 10M-3C3 TaxID=2483401 RepID=UPI000F635B55|nr:hypothetical protein [Microbacterium sp. 10M-3C3]
MTLPDGFAPVALDAAAGIPQTATLGPGRSAPLRLSVVAAASDLAALLSSERDRRLWASATARERRTGVRAPADPWRAADAAARAALAANPGDTLDPERILVSLIVHESRRVITVWPAIPGRPLPVRDAAGLRGTLWVEDVVISAGSLVATGATGARLAIAWQSGSPVVATPPAREEDPYVSLT